MPIPGATLSACPACRGDGGWAVAPALIAAAIALPAGAALEPVVALALLALATFGSLWLLYGPGPG